MFVFFFFDKIIRHAVGVSANHCKVVRMRNAFVAHASRNNQYITGLYIYFFAFWAAHMQQCISLEYAQDLV